MKRMIIDREKQVFNMTLNLQSHEDFSNLVHLFFLLDVNRSGYTYFLQGYVRSNECLIIFR